MSEKYIIKVTWPFKRDGEVFLSNGSSLRGQVVKKISSGYQVENVE